MFCFDVDVFSSLLFFNSYLGIIHFPGQLCRWARTFGVASHIDQVPRVVPEEDKDEDQVIIDEWIK